MEPIIREGEEISEGKVTKGKKNSDKNGLSDKKRILREKDHENFLIPSSSSPSSKFTNNENIDHKEIIVNNEKTKDQTPKDLINQNNGDSERIDSTRNLISFDISINDDNNGESIHVKGKNCDGVDSGDKEVIKDSKDKNLLLPVIPRLLLSLSYIYVIYMYIYRNYY